MDHGKASGIMSLRKPAAQTRSESIPLDEAEQDEIIRKLESEIAKQSRLWRVCPVPRLAEIVAPQMLASFESYYCCTSGYFLRALPIFSCRNDFSMEK
jgi:hypothetical protein